MEATYYKNTLTAIEMHSTTLQYFLTRRKNLYNEYEWALAFHNLFAIEKMDNTSCIYVGLLPTG